MNLSLAPHANDIEDLAGNDLSIVSWDYTVAVLPPVLEPEPDETPGTSNTIYWAVVPGADEYFAEYDDNADFSCPEGNSGWITDTQYTFTGLTPGKEYYYRVKAGQIAIPGSTGSWTQTSQVEFSSDTLSGSSATISPGDVVLAKTEFFDDDFEDGDFDGWFARAGSLGSPSVTSETAANSTTRSFKFVGGYENNSDFRTIMRHAISAAPSTPDHVSFYVRSGSTSDHDGMVRLEDVNGRFLLYFICYGDGTFYVNDEAYKSYSYSANTWYHIELHIDWNAKNFDFYVNSSPVHNNVPFRSSAVNSVVTVEVTNYTDGATAWWDEFTFYDPDYAASGSLVSTQIAPPSLESWGTLWFNSTTPAGTTLTVDVLPATGSTPIPGYENVSSGVDLRGITDTTTRLRANLATTNTSVTPELHDWAMSWQETPDTYIESVWSNVESSTQAPDIDWGDAPTAAQSGFTNSYPTTLTEDGARHTATGPTLGVNRDRESDGQPTADADGDDTAGAPDDEDGVTFDASTLYASTTAANTAASVRIDLHSADASSNRLDAWIDFNQDGDWNDPGEQIFTNYDLGTSSGVQTVNFTIPQDTGSNVELRDTYARFRLSTAGGLTPTGAASDGEVEDHKLTIVLPAPILDPEPAATADTTNTVYWTTVGGADAYLVEYDDNADFSSPVGNSGWITDTQYTFTGLTPDETYYYRLKARHVTDSWTQTSQTDFDKPGNTLLDVSTTTRLGDIVLGSGSETVPVAGVSNGSFESVYKIGYTLYPWHWTQFDQGSNVAGWVEDIPYGHMPTKSSKYVYLYSYHLEHVPTGSNIGYRQSMDLTEASVLRFAYDRTARPGTHIEARVYVDADLVWSRGDGWSANQEVDVSAYTGVHLVKFMLYVASGAIFGSEHVYFDDVRLYGSSYTTFGTFTSAAITPSELHAWDTLTFSDSVPVNTTLTVDILPATGSTPITGYENVSSGVDLSAITDTAIRLRANLSTTNIGVTPALHDWTVSWQTTPDSYVESGWSKVEFSRQDTTPPAVALAAPAQTDDTTPSATVTASDANGLPDGTAVILDVDLNNDGDFDEPGELGYTTSSLVGGTTTFDITPALADGTYLLRARVSDTAGNEGMDAKVMTVQTNQAPLADADGPYDRRYVIGEQDDLPLDGSASYDPDPGDSIVTYAWDLDNDGQFDDVVTGDPLCPVPNSVLQALGLGLGVHPIALQVTDTHGATGTDSTTLEIVTHPTVVGVMVNDGAAQRSMVTSLTVSFDRAVDIDPGAFVLVRRGGSEVLVDWDPKVAATDTVLTFDVNSDGVFGDPLEDGVYDLTVDKDCVYDAHDVRLATDHVFAFHRLFGDSDGDADVDGVDLNAFRSSYGKSEGMAGYLWYFDADDDDDVDRSDYNMFRANYRKLLDY